MQGSIDVGLKLACTRFPSALLHRCFSAYDNFQVWLQYGLNNSGEISIDFFTFDAITGKQKKQVRA